MKEKKRAKKSSSKTSAQTKVKVVEKRVSSEALRGVGAILFLALAGFLVIAELGGGGTVGQSLFSFLSYLLGVGYWLLPLSFAMLSVLVFRSFEERFGWVQILGLVVFLLSALGLVSLAFPEKGGVLGASVSNPLVSAIATPATVVFLAAFMIAALIISFDANLPALFGKLRDRFRSDPEADDYYEQEIDDVPVTGIHQAEHDDSYDEPAEAYEEAAPVVERKPAVTSFHDKVESEAEGGFPIIAATGSEYEPPPISLLSKNKGKPEVGDVKGNMNIIKRTLTNFGIQVEMDEASIGPTVTRYAMKPAEGVRLSKILALQSNLELALAASPVRIEAPIPGKSLVGIEVPNIARTTLGLAPIISDEQYTGSDKPLLMALGRTITGQAQYADIAKMPHLLVAGATGSGKSVTIHNFIVSLLYRCGPERLRFIMVDPKRVELTTYNSIPHLLTPVITDPKKAILALKWLAKEMDRRYGILETHHVRDISSYHTNIVGPVLEKGVKEGDTPPEAMPYIVVIIDELADIMQAYPRELEAGIVRLAQMSRAVGIHLILSTQRPSVKVITGLIKANIPARVALQVSSQIDSRTIIDQGGAEKLLGAGDMLFLSGEMSKPRRIQAPYLSEGEVKKVVAFIAKNAEGMLPSEIDFTETGKIGNGLETVFDSMASEEDEDELYGEAKKTVIEAGKASTSYLQRKLGVGYARAAKLIDMLEERGVVGPADGAKPRDVIGAGNADDLVRAAERQEEEQ